MVITLTATKHTKSYYNNNKLLFVNEATQKNMHNFGSDIFDWAMNTWSDYVANTRGKNKLGLFTWELLCILHPRRDRNIVGETSYAFTPSPGFIVIVNKLIAVHLSLPNQSKASVPKMCTLYCVVKLYFF